MEGLRSEVAQGKEGENHLAQRRAACAGDGLDRLAVKGLLGRGDRHRRQTSYQNKLNRDSSKRSRQVIDSAIVPRSSGACHLPRPTL
jgi:hypothetical protein